jgi:Ankyrin repeats (3 copies)
MFPNPQDALPLPTRPNLEQYKKRAKELASAANTGDSAAVQKWTAEWLQTLARRANFESADQLQLGDGWVGNFEGFVKIQKSAGKLPLSKAQFVLARAHGFESWPKFEMHLKHVGRENSAESGFEAAADAIVEGDVPTLQGTLQGHPELVRARSARQHRGTLLHYVAANGFESYRQRTPKNAVETARLLLDCGADVNAKADVYGVAATTLELVATSVHPERAGVQEGLMALLLDRGASEVATLREGRNVISACLANGRLRAAEFLAERGFSLDLEAAAGLGRLDLVADFFEASGNLGPRATKEHMQRGFAWACEYGRSEVVEFLMRRGASLHVRTSGQTPLHWAVIAGHFPTLEFLLRHGADLEAENAYGGTALGQALWLAVHSHQGGVNYLPVINWLVRSGARVSENAIRWVREQHVAEDTKQKIIEVLRPGGA